MRFDIEEHTKYNVAIDDEGRIAFEDVDIVFTNLINAMKRKNCRTVTCWDISNEPINYDIDEIIEFQNKLIELQNIFEIST